MAEGNNGNSEERRTSQEEREAEKRRRQQAKREYKESREREKEQEQADKEEKERQKRRRNSERKFFEDREQRMKVQEQRINKHIANIGDTIASTFQTRMDDLQSGFSANIDEQIRNLRMFSESATADMQDQWRSAMKTQQDELQGQLKQMEMQYKAYSKYMSWTDRHAYKVMYRNRARELDQIDAQISQIYSDEIDDIEELGKTWGETMSEMSDKLRDFADTLNLSNIANSIGEQVDGYIENLRQIRKRTGNNFDEDNYSDMLHRTAERTGYVMSRNEISGLMQESMQELNLYSKEIENYADSIVNANATLEATVDSFANILWMDSKSNQNGKLLQYTLDMATALDNSEVLNVKAEDLLSSLNENIIAIYGLSKKDSKKMTSMTDSLLAMESANSTVVGMDNFKDLVKEWSFMSVPEMIQDDNLMGILSLMGMTPEDAQAMLQGGVEGSIQFQEKFLDTLSKFTNNGQNAYMLNTLRQEYGLGEHDYEMSYWLENADAYLQSLRDFSTETAEATGSMAENALESNSSMDKTMNELSFNPLVTKISDKLEDWDITSQNVANAMIIGSGIIDAGKGIFNFVKGLKGGGGFLGGLKNIFTGGLSKGASAGASTGGGILNGLKGALGKGTSAVGSKVAGLFPSGIGSALSSAGSSMLSGQALSTGGLALAGTATLGLAGGAMAVADGVKGYQNANKWLGDDGNLTSGKISSTVGGVLGGGDGVFSKDATTGQKVKNVAGNTAKYALIGGAIGSIIPGVGTAIGAGVGAIAGAVTGVLGGDTISKAIQGTWNFAKDCANEAFNVVGDGVQAVNGVLQELGPVGQAMGDVLTGSWDAITGTKDKIEEVWADPNKGLVSKIGGTVGAVFSGAGGVAVSIIKGAKNLGKKAWDGITGTAKKAWNGITSFASSTWEKVTSFASDAWAETKKTAGEVWQGLQDGVTTIAEAGKTLAEGAGLFLTGAGDFVQGIGEGIGNALSGAGDGVGNVLSGLGEGAGNVLDGIGSILFGSGKQSVDISPVLDNLTGDPILDRMDIIIAYTKSIAENGGTGSSDGIQTGGAVGAVYEGASGVWSAGKDVAKGVYTVGKDVVGGIYTAGKDVVGGAVGLVKDAGNGLISFIDAINPFANGLSYVPNDGLARLHEGEAVLTSGQADIVRAVADGGINFGANSLSYGQRPKDVPMSEENKDSLLEIITEAVSLSPLASIVSPILGLWTNSETLRKEAKKQGLTSRTDSGYTSTGSSGSGSTGFWGNLFGGVSNLFGGGNNSNTSPSGLTETNSGITGGYIYTNTSNVNPGGVSYHQADLGKSTITGGIKVANVKGKGTGLGILDHHPNIEGSGANRWKPYVIDALQANNLATDDKNINAVLKQINSESSGNPYVENDWDSNWKKGIPSKGLLQCIDDTFKAHMFFGRNDIWNGYDNMLAAIHYSKNRYGGGTALNNGTSGIGSGTGYAVGTPFIPEDQVAVVHKGEMIVPANQNPFNNGTRVESTSDNSDVVETLKWMVSRLESKLDQVIKSQNNTPTPKRVVDTSAVDRLYSF